MFYSPNIPRCQYIKVNPFGFAQGRLHAVRIARRPPQLAYAE